LSDDVRVDDGAVSVAVVGDDRRKAAEIRYLEAIPTEDEYRRFVSDAFRDADPDPSLIAALRSEQLAVRTYRALGAIVDAINDDIQTNARRPPTDPRKRDPDWERSAKRRQQRFGQERTRLRPLALAIMDEEGWRPGKPNPQARAQHRVKQLLLKRQTVTPEMWDQILWEEQEAAKARAAAEKARRKQERAAAKRGETLPQQRPETTGE
jgi:hypothetical protein